MIGRCLILSLALVGCGSGSSAVNAANEVKAAASQLKSKIEDNPNIRYGRNVISLLDQFDAVAQGAVTMDEKSIADFEKTHKVPEATQKTIRLGLQREQEAITLLKSLKPPKQFEEFHKQVLKSMTDRKEDLSKLAEAVKTMDKKQIAQILKDAETKGKERKEQMDKILKGKSAESFLGL